MDSNNRPSGSPPDDSEAPPDLDKNPPDLNEKEQGSKRDNSEEVGTPDQGTTQSASAKEDSQNYDTFEEMLDAYQKDIDEIKEGDEYGNNIVDLYDPVKYLQSDQTQKPTWAKIIMGAQEGDLSMFSSLELEMALLEAGVNTTVEWQWNAGHVPSEIFGDSFSLTVDQMYGEYVEGAKKITGSNTEETKTNGSASEPTGEDITSWVSYQNGSVELDTSSLIEYRTSKANKAVPGFDVIDYGQEDYVFGSETQDARHWNETLLDVFKNHSDELKELFNSNT